MIERSQDMRFPLESCHALRVVGKDGRQDLEDHLTPQLGVGGAIDLSHAARTELGGDPIMRNALAYHRGGLNLMAES